MAGIYIHIPFCKVKCSYCDFYKTTNTTSINELVTMLIFELWERRDYLNDQNIQTIYFGGGTPSLLNAAQLQKIIRACRTIFHVSDDVELTMEANPDDLNLDYLKSVFDIGVNRLSIGIQSFAQSDLKLMKRRHNPIQARNAVMQARKVGFKNISVDLIYGVPGMSSEQWKQNLDEVMKMNVEHISAYHLTYHKGTRLWKDLQKGVINEIDEQESVNQFNALVEVTQQNNFIHYEISNFALDGYYSKHNSSYWNQTEYIGLGPSAHSFNGVSRQWNIASLKHYLKALEEARIPSKIEYLTEKDRYNDYMITSLRTIWGVDLRKLKNEFGKDVTTHVEGVIEKYRKAGQLEIIDETIKLRQDGWFVSDTILTDFML